MWNHSTERNCDGLNLCKHWCLLWIFSCKNSFKGTLSWWFVFFVFLSETWTSLSFQVFVNFAKDQSDDYHSKDNSVRRKDVSIDMSTLSPKAGAAEGGTGLKESVMWPPDCVIMFCLEGGFSAWTLDPTEERTPPPHLPRAASCQSMQTISCGAADHTERQANFLQLRAGTKTFLFPVCDWSGAFNEHFRFRSFLWWRIQIISNGRGLDCKNLTFRKCLISFLLSNFYLYV